MMTGKAGEVLVLSDKLAYVSSHALAIPYRGWTSKCMVCAVRQILTLHSEFAADIMSMFSFTQPFGFVCPHHIGPREGRPHSNVTPGPELA